MYPIRVGIEDGTLDIREYDFQNDVFIGSNGTKYTMADIKYFIIPTNEMEKIIGKETKVSAKIKTK